MTSLHDVVEGWLLIDNQPLVDSEHDRIVEIAV
jgi:hypothetical protein